MAWKTNVFARLEVRAQEELLDAASNTLKFAKILIEIERVANLSLLIGNS